MYFPYSREKKFINTNYKLEPQFWDENKNCIKRTFPYWREFEQNINSIIHKIESFEFKLIENGKHLLTEHIDQILSKKQKLTSFLEFYNATLLDETHLKRGTKKEHKYTYNLLNEFASKATLDMIDYSFAKKFDSFLRDEKNLKQNTIHKHHQHVRRFFSEAKKMGLITEEPTPAYSDFKSKKVKSDRVALTSQELHHFENLKVDETDSMHIIKDLFLFSCYTGLRFEDVRTLTQNHIFTENEEVYIRKKMEKVQKNNTLNISILFGGKALELINKYKSDSRKTIFPIYENQHVNRVLKILAVGAGIKSNLSFHIARHTFGTILAEKTQNPYLIMELMGHADIKTSMIYIHYSLERINQQIKSVDWSLLQNSTPEKKVEPKTEKSRQERLDELEKLLLELKQE